MRKYCGTNSAHGGVKGEVVIIKETPHNVVFRHVGRGNRYGEKYYSLSKTRFDQRFRPSKVV